MVKQHLFSRKFGVMLVFALLILAQVSVTQAATTNTLNWVPGCDGFTSQGGSIELDRDNTGNGREVFEIAAVDGAGQVIFGPVQDSSFVGSSISVKPGASFAWTSPPTVNPILLRVTSLAGNGFRAQTVYATLGTCTELESAFESDVVLFEGLEDDADDITSPSIPLNSAPTRSVNPPNAGENEAGYLVAASPGPINLRSGDGPQYTVVGQVVGGDRLLVRGRNDDRSWWLVEAGGLRGWINGTLVIIRGNLTNVPVVPVDGEIFPPRLYISIPFAVRTAPSVNAAPICEIAGGREHIIAGQNATGTWFLLSTECRNGSAAVGWIFADNGALRNSGDLSIPVVD